MPGSRPSSSIRSWRAPSYTLEAGQSQATEAARERAQLLLGQFACRVGGLPEREHHKIFERLDVVRIDDRTVDLDGQHFSAAVDCDCDEAAACRTGDLRLGEFLLRGDHLLL